jgi:hypothetical protein
VAGRQAVRLLLGHDINIVNTAPPCVPFVGRRAATAAAAAAALVHAWKADLCARPPSSPPSPAPAYLMQRHELPLHHGQLAVGWAELLCANLSIAFKAKFLMVESNQ